MIAAVIPTRYRPPELATLLHVLAGDGVRVYVLDSDLYDHRIYAMWNAGVALARAEGATEIAVLNDDVAILPGTLPLMAAVLRAYPTLGVVYPDVNAVGPLPAAPVVDQTIGTWGAGGMTGFAFMFRAEIAVPFDEFYGWWYGDDAFEEEVRAAGYDVGRVVGLPVRHVANGSASRDWERLTPLIEADRQRWEGRVPA